MTPSFTCQTDPVLGTTITLDLGNSAGISTTALILIGTQRALIPTNRGGDLLVNATLFLPINLPPLGTTISGTLPNDGSLCGTTIDLQAIEADPGALMGYSFTEGLELMCGR